MDQLVGLQLNTLIQRDVKVPKGSGGGRQGRKRPVERRQRAEGEEAAWDWGKPIRVAEPESRTGRREAGRDGKWQARNVDSGMEALRGAAVADERKAVTSIGSRAGHTSAACLLALIRQPEKTVVGESIGEAPTES